MDHDVARTGRARWPMAALWLVLAVPVAGVVVPRVDPRCVESPTFATAYGRAGCPTPRDDVVWIGEPPVCEPPAWRWDRPRCTGVVEPRGPDTYGPRLSASYFGRG